MSKPDLYFIGSTKGVGFDNSAIGNFDQNPLYKSSKENGQNSWDAKKHIDFNFEDKCSEVNRKLNCSELEKDEDITLIDFFEIKVGKKGENYITEEKDYVFSKTKILVDGDFEERIRVRRNDPVELVFDTFKIDRKKLCGVDSLKKHIKYCKETVNSNQNEYLETYEKMLDILEKDEINILRISDYNTTGLFEKWDESMQVVQHQPWYTVLQAEAIGAKIEGQRNRGSHGKGKFSNFSLSELRTVFYHSRFSAEPDFTDNETIQRVFGSRTILASHNDPTPFCRGRIWTWSTSGLNSISVSHQIQK